MEERANASRRELRAHLVERASRDEAFRRALRTHAGPLPARSFARAAPPQKLPGGGVVDAACEGVA